MFLAFQDTQRRWHDAFLALPILLKYEVLLSIIFGVSSFAGLIRGLSALAIGYLSIGLLGLASGIAVLKRKPWSRIAIGLWHLLLLLAAYSAPQLPPDLPAGLPIHLWHSTIVLNVGYSLFLILYLLRSKRVADYFFDHA